MTTLLNRKILALAILSFGVLAVFTITQAQIPNGAVSFQKDVNSLFTITISDPQGIKEFSLLPAKSSVYGGGLSGCPTSFKSENVTFFDPEDFSPAMKGAIVDCSGNISEIEILPPVKGSVVSKIISLPAAEQPASNNAPAKTVEKNTTKKIEEPETLPKTIQFPVKELGNCADETACKLYCDDAGRMNECLAFAKKHNLLPKDELEKAEKFANIGSGPGGCKSQKSCEAYCNDVSRIDECVAFAKQNGFIGEKELEEAEKMSAFLKGGGKTPGGCGNRNACEVYCSSADNMDECIAFAEKSGMVKGKELQEMRKIMPLMKAGKMPGGCRSREQCENYCADENHLEECVAFAEEAGLLSDEDREIIRKTGGKGPGGCRGKAQCEAYCNDPVNQEFCFNWAQENGLMKQEDLENMRRGMQEFKQNFEQMPPEMTECMKGAVGEATLNKMLNGEPVFDRSIEGKMRACTGKFEEQIKARFGGEGGHGGPGGEGGMPDGFSGPGGCKTQEKCVSFCQTNPKECSSFRPATSEGGEFPGQGATDGQFPGGPGGCRTKEECMAYCQANPQECGGLPAKAPAPIPVPPESHEQIPTNYEGQYQQQYQEQYQQEYQRQYEQQYQQQYQQEYQQQAPINAPEGFPTSPEQYQQQYPVEYQQIQEEQKALEEHSGYHPTLGEFFLGLILNFLL